MDHSSLTLKKNTRVKDIAVPYIPKLNKQLVQNHIPDGLNNLTFLVISNNIRREANIFSLLTPSLYFTFSSVQFSSVAQSCPTLCDPMKHSTPGLPVHHQFLEFTQTHVHRGSDAIQPSHPLSSSSPPAPNASQHQSLFQ